ncbi:MAG: BolA family protein [Planctomycetota bacterium]
MSTSDVQKLLEQAFDGADVRVWDLTGTSDHFGVEVTAQTFAGKSLIEQHKLVHAAVSEHMGDGKPIHALQIKTRAPE